MSDYKIKVGFELDNDLKEQIDKYVHDVAFQLGLKYKLEKIELDEDDTLIMRIPTDESGDILVDYEEVREYYNALKNNVKCKNIFAIPDVLTFKVIDDDILELLAESINEELNKRKKINFTFNKNGENLGVLVHEDDRYALKKENTEEKLKHLENYITALQSRIDALMNK